MITKDQVLQALNEVIDPEIGMSLNELNMIREVNIDDKKVEVKMVLTASFCPLAGQLVEEVRKKTTEVAEGREVKVIVLDEPWTPPERFRR
ncbi:MAG: metal-sulfur cluster assembly factor [Euryarchaeota archaeon]|jgi:metal-sulfur cluster biosynthetic enzyme|nr:metal-sulfur cluster assembly factor [Euryarchaeota archaeon]